MPREDNSISASELEVMRVLWAAGEPLSIAEIREPLADTGWEASTIKTLVARLVKKGELTVQQGKVVNEELKRNVSQKLRNAADSLENSGKEVSAAVMETADDLLGKVEELTAEQRKALKEKLEQMDQENEAPKEEE